MVDAEPQGLCSTQRPRLACRRRHVPCEASSSRTFCSWGPFHDKGRPLWPYFCSTAFSASLPQLPQPAAVNTLQARGEQSLFPGRAQARPSRSATEPPWPRIAAWWVGLGMGRAVWGQGKAETTPGPLLCSVWKIPAPEVLLPCRWVTRTLWTMENSPHWPRSSAREPRLALSSELLQAAPNLCQQHFKLWPAQCYILTGQALLA